MEGGVRGLTATMPEGDEAQSDVPSLKEIMAAIKDLKGTTALKLDVVMIDVALLLVDYQKMQKVAATELNVATLQVSVSSLEEKVLWFKKEQTSMAAKLDDQEGRTRHNNNWVGGKGPNRTRQRRTLLEVKKALREVELEDMMLLPTRLRALANGKSWYFNTLEEVWNWLEGWCVVKKKEETQGQ
ncbi:hypothetical protein NDU88_001127 [Pleurodeles waltl]|uniref:Uncharacterized protein n=1 Tax=Pleurodeles waltl TaxID=8319 RepID=A0AAV7S7R2_PLEWA|nr:hypothetical protein NDU88_001127 [Pleurodeles waltl]